MEFFETIVTWVARYAPPVAVCPATTFVYYMFPSVRDFEFACMACLRSVQIETVPEFTDGCVVGEQSHQFGYSLVLFSIQCVLTWDKEPIFRGVSDLIKFRFDSFMLWAVRQALATVFGIVHHVALCVQLPLGVSPFCERQ